MWLTPLTDLQLHNQDAGDAGYGYTFALGAGYPVEATETTYNQYLVQFRGTGGFVYAGVFNGNHFKETPKDEEIVWEFHLRKDAPASEAANAIGAFASGYPTVPSSAPDGRVILWSANAWNCGYAVRKEQS